MHPSIIDENRGAIDLCRVDEVRTILSKKIEELRETGASSSIVLLAGLTVS